MWILGRISRDAGNHGTDDLGGVTIKAVFGIGLARSAPILDKWFVSNAVERNLGALGIGQNTFSIRSVKCSSTMKVAWTAGGNYLAPQSSKRRYGDGCAA